MSETLYRATHHRLLGTALECVAESGQTYHLTAPGTMTVCQCREYAAESGYTAETVRYVEGAAVFEWRKPPAPAQGLDTLFQRLKAAGCKMGNHCSDLHVEDTDTARRIIEAAQAEGHPVKVSYFFSQVERRQWLELPFCYDPHWER